MVGHRNRQEALRPREGQGGRGRGEGPGLVVEQKFFRVMRDKVKSCFPPPDSPVRSVSCCAGSGASVLSMGGSPPDHLWLTGEMSHHELLDASHAGVSVFLAEHSNSERGFLKDRCERERDKALFPIATFTHTFRLRKRVELVLNEGVSPGNKVEVVVSADDQDPVLIM